MSAIVNVGKLGEMGQQWEYDSSWKGPVLYEKELGRVTKYEGVEEGFKNIVHSPSGILSEGSFLTKTYINGKIVPILLNPGPMMLLHLNEQDGIKTRALQCNYSFNTGDLAVAYSIAHQATFVIRRTIVTRESDYRVIVDIFKLDMDTLRINHKVSIEYITKAAVQHSKAQFNPSGYLYIVDQLYGDSLRFKVSIIGSNMSSGLLKTNTIGMESLTKSVMSAIFVGSSIHMFGSGVECVDTKIKNNIRINYQSSNKIHHIRYVYYDGGSFFTLITEDKEFHYYDLNSKRFLVGDKKNKVKQVNLYKELQKSLGGINALIPTKRYSVVILPKDAEFFIEHFGLPDYWKESKITIDTKAFAAGKSITLSFNFGKDLERDFVIARKVWDGAFVKKGNKKKLLMNYPVLAALGKSYSLN